MTEEQRQELMQKYKAILDHLQIVDPLQDPEGYRRLGQRLKNVRVQLSPQDCWIAEHGPDKVLDLDVPFSDQVVPVGEAHAIGPFVTRNVAPSGPLPFLIQSDLNAFTAAVRKAIQEAFEHTPFKDQEFEFAVEEQTVDGKSYTFSFSFLGIQSRASVGEAGEPHKLAALLVHAHWGVVMQCLQRQRARNSIEDWKIETEEGLFDE